jgi:small-conductance mechanosensitive channel
MRDYLQGAIPGWAWNAAITALIAIVAVAIALVAHAVTLRIGTRLARRSKSRVDDIFILRLARPMRWIMAAIALSFAIRAVPLGAAALAFLHQLAGFAMPVLVGWLALALLQAFREIVEVRADISASDNLAARRQRTRIGILARIGTSVIIFITICMMMLSIPSVRSVGVTLMASAGLAGLAVGAAAQPTLKNLIAGIQMAFSEPIRIDDVVIVAGEWGRIEEIRLTYVVVRIWDERRLIVPVSKFLEDVFENWTRETSNLLGTAFLYVDPKADVPRLRAKLDTVVRAHPKWDGRVIGLHVTDIKPEVMELRALVSASDAGNAFDLRCDVREAMIAYISADMPEALPRRRTELSGHVDAATAG